MKTYKYFLMIGIIFTILSCNNSKQKHQNINGKTISADLADALDYYIENNPVQLPIKNSLFANGYSYPSYHLYFKKMNNDSILSIIHSPNFSEYDIDAEIINQDEEIYKKLKPDGYMIYKEKHPLIIFGSKKNYSLQTTLTKRIPDSLKANKHNWHMKVIRWNFRIKNGKVGERIR